MQKKYGFLSAVIWIGIFSFGEAQIFQKKQAQVDLLSEQLFVTPGETFWVAIRFQLEPHWHIYWENPGDTGVPPSVNWKLPEGVQAGPLLWPCPKRIEDFSLVNYAYEESVVFLTEMKMTSSLGQNEITLEAHVEWLLCYEICIHEETSLRLTLPLKQTPPEFDKTLVPLFKEARDALPKNLTEWTLHGKLGEKTIELKLFPPVSFSEEIQQLSFFPKEAGVLEDSASQIWKKTKKGYTLTLTRSISVGKTTNLLQGLLLMTQNQEQKAFQVQIPLSS